MTDHLYALSVPALLTDCSTIPCMQWNISAEPDHCLVHKLFGASCLEPDKVQTYGVRMDSKNVQSASMQHLVLADGLQKNFRRAMGYLTCT